MSTSKYTVSAVDVPGHQPSRYPAQTMAQARRIASRYRDRRDLRGQDVRIEDANGKLIEYAGPAR